MSRENDNGGVIHVRTVHSALHVERGSYLPQRVRYAAEPAARYNIAPTTTVDVVRLDAQGRRELVSMRWGLVPMWWQKALKSVPATFNARAETVADKPMFRDAGRFQGVFKVG